MLTLTLRTLPVGKRNELRDMILFFLVLSSLTMKRDQSLVSEDLNLLSKNEGEIRLSELNSENQRLGSEFATWEIEVKTKLNHKRNDIEELWDKTEIKTVKKQQENCMKILQFSFTCWEGQQDVSPNCFATNSVVKFWRKNWSNDESFRHRPPGGGGVLDISLGGEVRLRPSYPDPV